MTVPRARAAAHGLFIAGTDTGVGKTRLSLGLLRALQTAGWRAIGMKPIASGTITTDRGVINEDVASMMAETAPDLLAGVARRDINPYCFEWPVSPHIGADRAGIFVEIEQIMAAYQRLAAASEAVVVEGTGGWLTPIGPRATMADVASALELPVIPVVGLRLGCLNHALLSAEAIEHSGCTLIGWVGNMLDSSMAALSEGS